MSTSYKKTNMSSYYIPIPFSSFVTYLYHQVPLRPRLDNSPLTD